MILAIITAWLAYSRAKQHGRNAILWAIAGAATFIGTQLVVSFGIGIFLGFGVALWGWSERVYDDYTAPITIVAIIASFITSWLLLRYLDKAPAEEGAFMPPPPPPENFDDKI
jgi:MFS family permease